MGERGCGMALRRCGCGSAPGPYPVERSAAGARNQRRRPGRMDHRQRRYWARRRKVMHQGSLAPLARVSLPPESRALAPPLTRLRLPPLVCAAIAAGGPERSVSDWGSCASAAMDQ